jgi:ribosomal protein S18 acetylase RimI-like enzyme
MSEIDNLITSEAFPSSQLTIVKSQIHNILKEKSIEINTKNIIFKPLSEDDLNEVEALHKEWFPIKYSTEYFLNILNTGIALGAFLNINDKYYLIGSVLAVYRKESQFPNQAVLPKRCCLDKLFYPFYFAYIATIGVIDECRRLGIAKVLVDRVKDIINENPRCIGLYLHVIECNNSAIRFYKKLRLSEGKMIYDHYIINNAYFNARVFYELFEGISYTTIFQRILKFLTREG